MRPTPEIIQHIQRVTSNTTTCQYNPFDPTWSRSSKPNAPSSPKTKVPIPQTKTSSPPKAPRQYVSTSYNLTTPTNDIPDAKVTRRPLLHPSLPTPFSSPTSPKTLYITASSPFIPALKRIRKLLAEIAKREKQSGGAQANGRLKNGDVERGVADEAARLKGKDRVSERECVYLKAAGRAIPRALELGVQFRGECVVKVEMGSVRVIDDIEVKSKIGGMGGGGEDAEENGEDEEDVPETRIRTLSSVTVSIRAK